MDTFTVKRIRTRADWVRVRRLYGQAFPRGEKKPFTIIYTMQREGKADVWCFRLNGRFAGFAATINSDRLIMIDYLAVSPGVRGGGLGSRAMAAMCEAYADKGVFVEIESPYEPGEDQPERIRRKAFYERCGFTPSRTMADVFGVRYELMCRGCSVDYETYHAFYTEQYSAWAAEHITPAPYPDI